MNENMTPEEIQAIIDAYNKALADGTPISKELAEAMRDAQVGIKNYTSGMKASMGQLGTSIKGLGTNLADGATGASVFNDSINSAAKAVAWFASQFGPIGKVFGAVVEAGAKYVEAVNKQADTLFERYQELSRSGLASGMDDVFSNLQSMGYTMKEIGDMANVLKENSVALSTLGGTAATGAQKFAAAAKGIQDSDVGTQFKRMGLSVTDINTGIAGFIKMQQMNGVAVRMTNEQLASSAAAYIEKQDILTRLTGANAEQQQEIHRQALQRDSYAAKRFELEQVQRNGATQAERDAAKAQLEKFDAMESYFSTKAPGMMKGFLATASGDIASPEFMTFARTLPSVANNISDSSKDFVATMAGASNDALKTGNDATKLVQLGVSGVYEHFQDISSIAAAGTEDLQKFAEQTKKAQDDAKAGREPAVKAEVALRDGLRKTTQAYDRVINNGIAPTVTAMSKLATVTESAANGLESLLGKLGLGTKTKEPPAPVVTKLPSGSDQLIKKMSAAGITDKTAQANILSQVNAESGGVAKSEKLNYSPEQLLKQFPKQVASIEQARQVVAQGPEAVGNLVYGGRMGNAADEGYMYRGRGLIQLTGKTNYEHFGKLLGIDLVNKPDLANDPDIAQNIAIAYFKEKEKGENGKAGIDLSSIEQVGKAVGYQDIGGEETRKRAGVAQFYRSMLLGSDNAGNTGELPQDIPVMGKGGITSGLTLAGEIPGQHEAVVPLPNGKTIPVELSSTPTMPAELMTYMKAMGQLESQLSLEKSRPEAFTYTDPKAVEERIQIKKSLDSMRQVLMSKFNIDAERLYKTTDSKAQPVAPTGSSTRKYNDADLSGPTSGFQKTLDEIQTKLPTREPSDTLATPSVETPDISTKEQLSLLAHQLDKMDTMIAAMNRANSINSKILQRQS